MAELVYMLCAVTSVGCAALLVRSWLRTRMRLLLWSSLCFTGLAANNVLLFVDLVMTPEISLTMLRQGLGLGAMSLLVFGLIWESK